MKIFTIDYRLEFFSQMGAYTLQDYTHVMCMVILLPQGKRF